LRENRTEEVLMAGRSDSRVVWVTGAGSGMGRASSVVAAAGGRRVALSGRRSDALEEVAREVEAAGGSAYVVPLDVTDVDAVAEAHRRIVGRWGAVSDLVLSAGLNTPRRSWAEQSIGEFQRIVATNLTAVTAVVDVALPDLRAASGTVVMISSISAWTFSPNAGVAYSASKTAVGALCRSLNAQEAGSGVRATHLCPGDVDTEFLDLRPQAPDAAAREVMLRPEDVARVVGFVLDSPPHVRIDELVISPTGQR
jgi:NADP-dependent 3-hydroxy acid dehydrogenase YdfG